MSKVRLTVSALLCLGLSAPAAADSIYDMVQKLPTDQFASSKSREALEYSIGLKIGDWLTPITMHGEKQVLVYGSPTTSFSNVI